MNLICGEEKEREREKKGDNRYGEPRAARRHRALPHAWYGLASLAALPQRSQRAHCAPEKGGIDLFPCG